MVEADQPVYPGIITLMHGPESSVQEEMKRYLVNYIPAAAQLPFNALSSMPLGDISLSTDLRPLDSVITIPCMYIHRHQRFVGRFLTAGWWLLPAQPRSSLFDIPLSLTSLIVSFQASAQERATMLMKR